LPAGDAAPLERALVGPRAGVTLVGRLARVLGHADDLGERPVNHPLDVRGGVVQEPGRWLARPPELLPKIIRKIKEPRPRRHDRERPQPGWSDLRAPG